MGERGHQAEERALQVMTCLWDPQGSRQLLQSEKGGLPIMCRRRVASPSGGVQVSRRLIHKWGENGTGDWQTDWSNVDNDVDTVQQWLEKHYINTFQFTGHLIFFWHCLLSSGYWVNLQYTPLIPGRGSPYRLAHLLQICTISTNSIVCCVTSWRPGISWYYQL